MVNKKKLTYLEIKKNCRDFYKKVNQGKYLKEPIFEEKKIDIFESEDILW